MNVESAGQPLPSSQQRGRVSVPIWALVVVGVAWIGTAVQGCGAEAENQCPVCDCTETSTSTMTTSTSTITTTTYTTTTRTTTSSIAKSLLLPVSVSEPDKIVYPRKNRFILKPAYTAVTGPKQTNKFWGNWVVEENGAAGMGIYPAPYRFMWEARGGSAAAALKFSHGTRDFSGGDPIQLIISHFVAEFSLGINEELQGHHSMIKEELFGVHAQVTGPSGRKVTYPIYAGQAYITAHLEGSCTPFIKSDHPNIEVEKVNEKNGTWTLKTARNKEYRLWAFTEDGVLVDGSYDFDPKVKGLMTRPLNGWIRMAHILKDSDRDILDKHAGAILTGWELHLEEGVVQYNFETLDKAGVGLLHFAYANHIDFLSTEAGNAIIQENLTKSEAPVKGDMTPLVGNKWIMRVDTSKAKKLSYLPENHPADEFNATINTWLSADLDSFLTNNGWRLNLFRRDHYFSGKGYQKLGMLCLMSSRHNGKDHAKTQACASALAEAFQCMWNRRSGEEERWVTSWEEGVEKNPCGWAPPGTYYDLDWKGTPSRWADDPICGLDFGNSCYNDHHYHFGYFVVAGAILVDLQPQWKSNYRFVDLINMFIRDTANPSKDDYWFPQFRAFDWFDMHSWSRGLAPNQDGKDQESTSEEVNLHYGVMLWGRAFGNGPLEDLGALMLTVASQTLTQYFLMTRDNSNYPPAFTKNHVTGIFFQGKVHLTTWFGADRKYIQGIQMLPMTPAVPLSRTHKFAVEEWEDQIVHFPLERQDKWTSLLITGNMAFFNTKEAFERIELTASKSVDDGLTKSWALYWSATACTGMCNVSTATTTTTTGPATTVTPGSGVFCAPGTEPPQMCPSPNGDIPCPQCGSNACECPIVNSQTWKTYDV